MNPGGNSGVTLAAGANVLLSAVVGARATDILAHQSVDEVVTAEATFQEVQEYASQLARKKRLSLDVVLLAVAALPVRVVAREDYAGAVPKAEKRIGGRDPDDIDLLALAIQLQIPVWSNHNDFEGTGVEWYTTAELLKRLFCPPGPAYAERRIGTNRISTRWFSATPILRSMAREWPS